MSDAKTRTASGRTEAKQTVLGDCQLADFSAKANRILTRLDEIDREVRGPGPGPLGSSTSCRS